MDEPWLDACLIVKNEEESLPRSLMAVQRIAPIIRRICVYDTGSDDATVSIARAAGCHVEEGDWDDDFARARNASLAMSDAPWALIVDADDEVEADVRALSRLLMGGGDLDVVDASCTHLDESGTARSTTRRVGAVRPDRVRFEGTIHEVPSRIGSASTRSRLAAPDALHFRHWGYASPAIRREKARRNLSGAQRDVALARQGSDAVRLASSLFHRGRTWLLLEESAAAAADLAEAFDLAYSAGARLWLNIAPETVRALVDSGHHADAISMVERIGAEPSGEDVARFLLGQILLRIERPAEAYDVLSTVRTEATEGIDAGGLFALRLRAARACGRADEVLAELLVLVSGERRLELLPHLMDAWGDQPAQLLAGLLRESSGDDVAKLRRALRQAGETGRRTADLL